MKVFEGPHSVCGVPKWTSVKPGVQWGECPHHLSGGLLAKKSSHSNLYAI